MSAATHGVPGMSFAAEQHERRRLTLGASEIPAVAGLSPHRSPFDVYLEKRGMAEPFAGNQFTEWGLRLERAICDKYAEANSDLLVRTCQTMTSDAEPWMSATPDRLVRHPSGERWGLEAKNKSARQAVHWGESGTDQVPHEIAAQCYWGMMVTGLARWDVVALFGGNEWRCYSLRYDAEIAAALLDAGRTFWFEHVVPGVPPDIDGSAAAHRFLAERFRTHSDALLPHTPITESMVRKLRALREQRVELEAAESAIEARLKHTIGEAAGIQGPNWRVTWKAPKPTVVTDYKGLVQQLAPAPEVLAQFTHERPNSRRFLVSFPKQET